MEAMQVCGRQSGVYSANTLLGHPDNCMVSSYSTHAILKTPFEHEEHPLTTEAMQETVLFSYLMQIYLDHSDKSVA